jgi:selenocysteine-specific elongation factor
MAMQVIATAGHVDHGKSTLLRALTGMDPDRWEEERRRGLTIDLGYAWLTLPSGQELAFVDVPGHERFVPNMLAGIGPVPAVLFVVAADEGWMPQSAEHLAVLDALGMASGLLVVTRADLADPGPAMTEAAAHIRATTLGEVATVAVSAVTGQGLPDLLTALDKLADSLPVPDPGAPVRLWVDRAFSITGSGTVVTGTLPAGTVHREDELVVTPSMRPVRVRGIQSRGQSAPMAAGVSRTALNLRGISRDGLARGMALVQAGRWTMTDVIDVRITSGSSDSEPGPSGPAHSGPAHSGPAPSGPAPSGPAQPAAPQPAALHSDAPHSAAPHSDPPRPDAPQPDAPQPDAPRLPRTVMLHIGSARTAARVRPLAGPFVRLQLSEALPLHVGDHVLLRDPGAARAPRRGIPMAPAGVGPGHVIGASAMGRPATAAGPAGSAYCGQSAWPTVLGAVVLDVMPPPLIRRGAAAAAARAMASWPDQPTARDLLHRHVLLRASALLAMGVSEHPEPVTGEWLADPGYWRQLSDNLGEVVTAHAAREPLAPGLPLEAARAALGLPDRRLVEALVRPPLRVRDGMVQVMAPAALASATGLPDAIEAAVRILRADLARAPFLAPDADRLRKLGLDVRGIAAAARLGVLLRVSDQIVLAPGADVQAASILAGLPQPFTAADARQALDTTRRIAIPLLEYLDRAGITERLPDDRRIVRPQPPQDAVNGAAPSAGAGRRQ